MTISKQQEVLREKLAIYEYKTRRLYAIGWVNESDSVKESYYGMADQLINEVLAEMCCLKDEREWPKRDPHTLSNTAFDYAIAREDMFNDNWRPVIGIVKEVKNGTG